MITKAKLKALHPKIQAIARRYAATPYDAEDYTQSACLHLLTASLPAGATDSYILHAAAYLIRTALRTTARRRNILSQHAAELYPAPGVPTEAEDAAAQAVRTLPAQDREIIRLRYDDGLTVREAARAARLSLSAFQRRLARIHTQIRTRLA